jgi:putative DNA primase/helicase
MWEISQILGGKPSDADAAGDQFDPSPKAQVVSASAVPPARVEWLWPGRIPLGMLTLFSGDPKLAKSMAALSVLAAVTRGGPLPGGGADGPAMAPLGSAILLSAEDDPARTIVPRLRAAGADLDRVKIINTIREPEFRGFESGPAAHVPGCERMPTLSAPDLQAIERAAAELGDCRLIVFDPISDYVGGRAFDVRRALAPLRDMAQRLGAAIVLINHHSKQGASGTNGKYRVLGSIAYVGVCRANFLFLADPDDPTGRRRLMLDNGGNLAPQQPALAYVVNDDGEAARVDWLPETIDLDADAALARAVKARKSATSGRLSRRHSCEEWLRGYLAGGPKLAKECEQAAMAAGFNRALVERARIALAIRSVRTGFGKGSACHLYLPDAEGGPPDRPDDAISVHTPQFPAPEFHEEYVDYGRHLEPAPLAGRAV